MSAAGLPVAHPRDTRPSAANPRAGGYPATAS